MRWETRLLEEAKRIVSHGKGKLEFNVTKRENTKVSIICGKRWDFEVEIEEED